MVLDVTLLNTQHYKVGIEGKVQSRGRSSAETWTVYKTDAQNLYPLYDALFKNAQSYILVFWSTRPYSPLHDASLAQKGGARGVMVIVTGYGHGDTRLIPGQDRLHFHIALIPLGKV